jgi:hypothetical protein
MESRRHVVEAGMHVELVANDRWDGHWEAHVAAWSCLRPTPTAVNLTTNRSAALWPSVKGPTAAVSLDALEAELREVIGSASNAPIAASAPLP